MRVMSKETGKFIKARLKAMDKTQGWLAENIKVPGKDGGLSTNAISKWTKTGNIARAHIQQVADLLNVTADELLCGGAALELVPEGDTTIERVDAEEKELLELHRASTKDGRNLIMASAHIAPKLPVRSIRRPN